MGNINFLEVAARRKLGLSDAWKSYRWEVVSGGVIVDGEITTATYSRGPRKGKPKFTGKGTRVVVTDAEVKAEEALYVQTTGNCLECQGTGQEFESWTAGVGIKTRPCRKCEATGKAR
jgi:hypothetical protein